MSIFKSAFRQLGHDVGRLQPFDLETYHPRIQLQTQTASPQQTLRADSQTVTSQPSIASPILPPVLAQQGNSSLGTALMVFVPIVGAGFVFWLLNTTIRICDPNRILVISGRQQTVNGRKVGYRVEFGGQTYCIPILETVKSMDMRTMPVPIEVINAYARGGTPLSIQAIANVKISSDPIIVRNAIERFLDRGTEEIKRVARETLEGNLRGVVATLTPEQLNEDRLEFAERIANDVSDDLAKLGLHLDTLKIQSVSDDVDYLDSIGRKQIAMILRDAEMAESDAIAAAETIEDDCTRQSEVAKTQAKTLVQEKENELREVKAKLEETVREAEERTQAAAETARAKAEQKLQSIRAELARLRLEVEEILPAQARQEAKELLARGEAASLAENARASAMANTLLTEVWEGTGDSASELFALQQIDLILEKAAQVPGKLQLSRVNAIDRGDGKTLAGLMNVYPAIVTQFLAQVEGTLGINLIGKTPLPTALAVDTLPESETASESEELSLSASTEDDSAEST